MALNESDALPRAVIADPRAVAARWPDARMRVLASITRTVTEEPWALSSRDRAAAESAGLTDEHLLHAVALSAFFGHLNRIADAVGVPLDYPVQQEPPHAEPATPPLSRAPSAVTRPSRIAISQRPATAAAIDAWGRYVMERDTGALRGLDRVRIAARAAALLGLPVDEPPADSALDEALLALADRVTLAPWQLGDEAYRPLRALGFDDAALFDAVVVASSAGVAARIEVALRALEAP